MKRTCRGINHFCGIASAAVIVGYTPNNILNLFPLLTTAISVNSIISSLGAYITFAVRSNPTNEKHNAQLSENSLY
jgi:hypothetical protein